METGALTKITARQADEVLQLARAADRVLPAIPGATPAVYLQQLMAKSAFNDAVHFLAFGLPKREAVWWACVSARADLRESAPPPVAAALAAAEAWVYRPTEELRYAAWERAKEAKFETPSAWAAVAAFWSGPSLAPPDLPAVPPSPHLTGVAVSGAVTLAAVQTEAALADQKRQRYIKTAIDIANGGSGRNEAKGS
ncbi:MAG TPA: hypothetical protein VHT51_21295 [Micropepsaceae bacterium]|nr:hypothetical protein [Micropepsaceae bacterium]